jgi:hypothetical protein
MGDFGSKVQRRPMCFIAVGGVKRGQGVKREQELKWSFTSTQ